MLDEFPFLKKRREIFVAGLLTCCFFGSLATTTYGGKYLFQLLDMWAAPISILFIVFMESVAVSWCYGKYPVLHADGIQYISLLN